MYLRMGERVWIGFMVQIRDCWWALVNTVLNLWVPEKAGYLLTS
jgi:hypothetical protein